MKTVANKAAESKAIKVLAKEFVQKNRTNSVTKLDCKNILKVAGIKQTLYEDLFAAINILRDKLRTKLAATCAKALVPKIAAAKAVAVIALTITESSARINYSKKEALIALEAAGLKKSLVKDLIAKVRKDEEKIISDCALATYYECYRAPEAGHGNERVVLVSEPHLIGVSQDQSMVWDMYRGSYKGWGATVTDTKISLSINYMERVFAHNIDEVDGLMTLDASPLPAPEGFKLFDAKWLVQERGYKTSVVSGFIAINASGKGYHADTAVKAIKGLLKKVDSEVAAKEWTLLFSSNSIEKLAAQLPKNAVVKLSDARAIGACEYGIKSWCASTSLDYEKGRAPILDVIGAYQAHPRIEARAAIIHALRSHRSLLKLAA